MIRTILLYPFYLLSVFTVRKDFLANPVIGNPFLNRLGLHVLRVRLTHAIFAFKQWCLSPLAAKKHRDAFARDGFVVVENALPPEDFARLKDQAVNFNGEAWQMVQGDTVTWWGLVKPSIMKNRRVMNLIKYCAGSSERPRMYLQQVQRGFVNAAADPQETLHADTFHPTMKAWLFLQDVDDRHGPFTYAPGSHALTSERLNWEHRKSLEQSRTDKKSLETRGSFRTTNHDVIQMGFAPAKSLHVKENTLVIANTFGFHRRGDSTQKQSTRLELFFISRLNPFNPIPIGFGAAVRDTLYHFEMKRRARKLEKQGRRTTWHRGPASIKKLK